MDRTTDLVTLANSSEERRKYLIASQPDARMVNWSTATIVVIVSAIVVGIHAESSTVHPPSNIKINDVSSKQPALDRPGAIRNQQQSASDPNDSSLLPKRDNSTATGNQTALPEMNDNFPNEAENFSNGDLKTGEPKQKISSSFRERLFFGSLHTQTHIIVTFSTTTVPQFCLLGTAETACLVGRRKKRRSLPIALHGDEMQDEIESSVSVAGSGGDVREVEDGGKKFFTVWTKFLTTTTLTTTTTNTASTISLSYYCTAGSISLPANCG
ncbi:hypothetical protein FHG87_011272 [Trinorchestia longiramus]|nr:hypothetical protein FHG87_011272 [Trinorchestia longiramus]